MPRKDGEKPKTEAIILHDDPGTGLRRGDKTTSRERAERSMVPRRVENLRDSQKKGRSR